MKNFVKVLAILLAVFMALAVFAACGKKNDDKPDDKPADTTPVDDKPADDTPKHEHAWGEGKVTKEATCTEEGEKTFTCSGCNETKTEKIAALGHTWDEGKVTKEATVDEEGEKTFTCTVCGETKTEKIDKVPAPATPEKKGTPVKGSDAMYKANGDNTYTYLYFTGDDEATEVKIPATLNGLPVVAIDNEAFEGFTQYTSITIENGIKTIGESAFAGCTGLTGIIIPDSVTEIGENAFKGCTGLQMVKLGAGTAEIPANAFDGCTQIAILDLGGLESLATGSFASAKASLVNVTLGEKMVELSGCFEDAVKDYKLVSIVNNSKEKDFEPTGKVGELINKIAETKEDEGIDIHVEIVNNYVFYLDKDGKVSLVSYIGATQEEEEDEQDNSKKLLVLPESYGKDKEDYTIYKYAFYNRTDIAKVEIPASVTTIGTDAFGGTTKPTTVTMPVAAINSIQQNNLVTAIINGGTKIPAKAFKDCTTLTTVKLPAGLTEIGDEAFYGCTKLYTIEIPDSITYIADTAFDECDDFWAAVESTDPTANPCIHKKNNILYLGNATNPYVLAICELKDAGELDEHTKGIYAYAFPSTPQTSITIPAEVRFIGACAFENGDLATVNFATGSQLKIIGAAAFDNNDDLTAITIPASVTTIGVNAFYGCDKLDTLTFAEGSQLKAIGDTAFDLCVKLTAVTLPDGLTTIGECAFLGCEALATINFAGTSTQWAAVTKDTSWDNSTGDYTVYCSDGTVAKDGTVTPY